MVFRKAIHGHTTGNHTAYDQMSEKVFREVHGLPMSALKSFQSGQQIVAFNQPLAAINSADAKPCKHNHASLVLRPTDELSNGLVSLNFAVRAAKPPASGLAVNEPTRLCFEGRDDRHCLRMCSS